jgi:hypothetical protein
MDAKALGAAVVRDIHRIALRLRHQDLQIGGDDRAVAIDRDMGQRGEMREPALDRGLMIGAEHLIGDVLASARAREILAAIENTVFHPARRDMIAARRVGAGRMAGDEVVDFKPVLDRTDAVFEAFVDSHALLPKRQQIANGQ